MITLTPTSTPVDISHVMHILTMLVDPSACKARFSELQELLDRANFGIERAEKMQADVTQRQAIYETSAANLAQDKAAFAKMCQDTNARHDSERTSIATKSADLNDREDRLSTLAKSIDQREKELSKREADLKAREDAVAESEAQADARHEDITRRLKIIQSAAVPA